MINFENNSYSTIPQIIMRIFQNIEKIKAALSTIDIEELKETWNCEVLESNRFLKWVELI